MAGNKENMRQAMKELLGLVGVGSEEKQDEVDLEEARQEVADTMDKQFFQSSAASEMGGVGQPFLSDPMRGAGEDDLPEAAPFIRPGATVISAGTSLFGDLRAEGDVEVLGKLKGNLEATGNVRITGKVLGDVKGGAVTLAGCAIQGNITATASVCLDEGALVVGDILATDLESGGKVKGNLQIARSASFLPKAVLAGNVSAGMISICQGAQIQGAMRIAEDPETNSLFGDGLEI